MAFQITLDNQTRSCLSSIDIYPEDFQQSVPFSWVLWQMKFKAKQICESKDEEKILRLRIAIAQIAGISNRESFLAYLLWE